jgi:hypothetical protein
MGQQFDELPRWEFTVVEADRAMYKVRALRDGGISGEATDSDPDAALEGLRQWAAKVEADLAARAERA